MKKNLIIMTLLILIVTGCKEKQLICNMEQIKSENIISYEINAYFKKDKVDKLHLEINTNLADKYVEYSHLLEQELLESYVQYQNKEGIKFNTSRNNNIVTLDIEIEFSELTEELKKGLGISSKSSYKDAKKSLESSGFVCK